MNQLEFNQWLAAVVNAIESDCCITVKSVARAKPTHNQSKPTRYWMAPVKLASTKRFEWELK